MKPELVSDEKLEDLFAKHKAKESPTGWTLQAYVCVQKEAFLEGARAALEELGVVLVQNCTVVLPDCPLRRGDECTCVLTKGAVLVKAKEKP